MKNRYEENKLEKMKQNRGTNGDWLDSLDEKELLLILSGLLYSYDNRLSIFDENGDLEREEWKKILQPMVKYVENRLGRIMSNEAYKKWEELSHK
jgi:hypothetical protein